MIWELQWINSKQSAKGFIYSLSGESLAEISHFITCCQDSLFEGNKIYHKSTYRYPEQAMTMDTKLNILLHSKQNGSWGWSDRAHTMCYSRLVSFASYNSPLYLNPWLQLNKKITVSVGQHAVKFHLLYPWAKGVQKEQLLPLKHRLHHHSLPKTHSAIWSPWADSCWRLSTARDRNKRWRTKKQKKNWSK